MLLIWRARAAPWRQKGSCRRNLVAAAEDIGLWSGALIQGESLVLQVQRAAPADDHPERQDEEQAGGLLRRNDGSDVSAQRQTDCREREDDDDEPGRAAHHDDVAFAREAAGGNDRLREEGCA